MYDLKVKENEPINQSIGLIVARNFKAAEVFRKYDIDFCCGGKRSLEEVCKEKNIDPEQILKDLESVNEKTEYNLPYDEWSLPEIVKHIVDQHHYYVRESLPILSELCAKVANVHGERHPELHQIKSNFEKIAQELDSHMKKEEHILFPYINQLHEAFVLDIEIPPAAFKTIRHPIEMMEAEHEVAGDLMAQIKDLSGSYIPPRDSCTSYRVLFAKLDEFEKDLHTHIHLENNILFLKAFALESKLAN